MPYLHFFHTSFQFILHIATKVIFLKPSYIIFLAFNYFLCLRIKPKLLIMTSRVLQYLAQPLFQTLFCTTLLSQSCFQFQPLITIFTRALLDPECSLWFFIWQIHSLLSELSLKIILVVCICSFHTPNSSLLSSPLW